jgi:CheY-like chemotaxis protein
MADAPYTILIADDQNGQRVVLDMLLSLEGYQLELVADGREALDYLKDHTPDLAILDIDMPFLTGIEICDRMRRVPRLRPVPVIILTGLRDESSLTMARLVQADRVIMKPLEGKDFREIVRELISTPRKITPVDAGPKSADDLI